MLKDWKPSMTYGLNTFTDKIIADCSNKTGDMYFLEKGVHETHGRLTKKVKNLINCSHIGMFCMKGCPRAKETSRAVFRDRELSNDMALINGQVLYEVINTSSKPNFKYDRELAKLSFPNRLSPIGPVTGTKSSQPPMKKILQHFSSRSRPQGNAKKSPPPPPLPPPRTSPVVDSKPVVPNIDSPTTIHSNPEASQSCNPGAPQSPDLETPPPQIPRVAQPMGSTDPQLNGCRSPGCSLCMKGCPRAKETSRAVFRDRELSNDMALINGQVLYEVINTSSKPNFKYDRELAKLSFPNRLSPIGPVTGTKSSQPPMKKILQHFSSRSRPQGNAKKSPPPPPLPPPRTSPVVDSKPVVPNIDSPTTIHSNPEASQSCNPGAPQSPDLETPPPQIPRVAQPMGSTAPQLNGCRSPGCSLCPDLRPEECYNRDPEDKYMQGGFLQCICGHCGRLEEVVKAMEKLGIPQGDISYGFSTSIKSPPPAGFVAGWTPAYPANTDRQLSISQVEELEEALENIVEEELQKEFKAALKQDDYRMVYSQLCIEEGNGKPEPGLCGHCGTVHGYTQGCDSCDLSRTLTEAEEDEIIRPFREPEEKKEDTVPTPLCEPSKEEEDTIQPPTILPALTPSSRKTCNSYLGPGLSGGAQPKLKNPGDKREQGKMAAEAAYNPRLPRGSKLNLCFM